jgi:hypothetical protein
LGFEGTSEPRGTSIYKGCLRIYCLSYQSS